MAKDKDKAKGKQEPWADFNPYALKPSETTAPRRLSPDELIPPAYQKQWEIGEMVLRTRADMAEQELTTLKGMAGQNELRRIVDYLTTIGVEFNLETFARLAEIDDPIIQGQLVKFFQAQMQIWGSNSRRIHNETMKHLRAIVARSIHVDPEDKPKPPPPSKVKKSFWGE